MGNVSGAPGIVVSAGRAHVGTVIDGPHEDRSPGSPIATTAPPRIARGVVVLDVEYSDQPDRLDDELVVSARLVVPLRATDLRDVLLRHRPRALLCKVPLDRIDSHVATTCRAHGVEVYVLAEPNYGLLRPTRLWRFGGQPWLRLASRSSRSLHPRAKRALDLALVVATAPVSLSLMLVILLAASFGGPPFYVQRRVGAGGREFPMLKFRTMRVNAERDTGPALATAGDQRVTAVGRVLRRYRLDELPQLLNVLCGHMSLVGPRPERPEFVAQLGELPNYDQRHCIRPGMTGIAQLTGGYAATAEEKLRCDLLYVNSRSLRADVALLLLTAIELFRGFPRG
jgi:lipopolysaccharide/colanic/teichoic acid biosynthesis glycosyltransferase